MVGGGSGVSMMAFPVGADAPDLQRFQNSSCMKRDWVLRWWYEEKLAARVLVNEGGTVTAKFKLELERGWPGRVCGVEESWEYIPLLGRRSSKTNLQSNFLNVPACSLHILQSC